ncbi:putative bifunctional diguanylate cyclase/phosphodiesterase [Salana multivorans]
MARLTRLDASKRTMGVARRLSDHAVFVWGAIWAAVVGITLAVLWVEALPVREPIWLVVVFISVAVSAGAGAAISRVDATLSVGAAPAMILIAVQTTGWAEGLAICGTAYLAAAIFLLRDLGDAAETAAYLLGGSIASLVSLAWLDRLNAPWPVTAAVFVGTYLVARVLISFVRLSVVTHLSLRRIAAELMVLRLALAWVIVTALAIGMVMVDRLIVVGSESVGPYWAGAITIFLAGIACFGASVLRESRVLSAQLSGTLEAALELPWDPETDIGTHALGYARIAMPRYGVALEREASRNVNEIVSPLGGRYLVARRGATQPPFLVQDQRVLDAVAHIAETMAAARREREDLSRTAATDDLTGLANYRGFREILARTAEAATEGFAVVYIDVDHFKEINDRHGHEMGNAVLRALAGRLRDRISPTDFVARLGGDEFVLILCGVDDDADGRRRAGELLSEVSAPLVLGGTVLTLSLSWGLAFAGPGDGDVSRLVETADARMYAARGRGVPDGGVAGPAEERDDDDVVDLVSAISEAIRGRRLVVRYQPIVHSGEDRIVGFEALIRPDECELAGVPAEVIVHEAQRLGLLTELSTHVIETAVSDMVRFQGVAPGLRDVSVNIDVEQITDPQFAAVMAQAAATESVRVTLELSETSLNRTSAVLDRELERLGRSANVRIALDDFGRASSTLLSVMRYPLDVLKVDRSLIQQMGERKPQLVLQAMALLAANLEVTLVVEGVEDEDTRCRLTETGVCYMQGYLFGAALSADEVMARLTRHGLRARVAD